MCSVPVTLLDGSRGTINVYRNVSRPFSENEVRTVEQLTSLIPALYQTIRDKVSLSLINSIDEIINDAELRSRDLPLSLAKMKTVFKSICERIAATFFCIEASLFLHADLETPGRYELMATTWRGRFKKTFYRSSVREGVTGWVLSRGKPIRIFDFANFDRDKKGIRERYPDVVWRDSLEMKTAAQDLLGLAQNGALPPLSFMAAPIVIGDELLGVIRCSTLRGEPYYFDDRDLDLLMLVAAEVGRYASSWLGRREMQQENESWRALVRSDLAKVPKYLQDNATLLLAIARHPARREHF